MIHNICIKINKDDEIREIEVDIDELLELIKNKDKEIERLNNIINEFEKYLEESKRYYEEYTCAIKKLKELKGDDKK